MQILLICILNESRSFWHFLPNLPYEMKFVCKSDPKMHQIVIYTLVWPQWWSFIDVSQQGLHFSKKISKMKIFFWFDFHRCSHGPSKIRRHFRNKSRSILKLSKNVFYKKCGPKLIFFNEKKIQKDSNDFWHRKLTLKVRFRHFLTTPVNICESQIKKIFLFYWFFC